MTVSNEPAKRQRRGVERRRALLEAAEQLLAEQGYEAATLKAIGDRVGIPVASVYHYFADRHEIESELLARHLPRIDQAIEAAWTASPLDSLDAAVGATIDPMLAYFEAHPACVELWFVGRHQKLTDLVAAFHDRKSRELWRLLLDRSLVAADTPQLPVRIGFEAGSHLFDVAFRGPSAGPVMAEARRLLVAYLQSYSAHARH